MSQATDTKQDDLTLWSLSRIDIRSPIAPAAWPVARVELDHPARGRVTEIGSAPGAFDAVFLAASRVLDIAPTLLSYNVRSDPPEPGEALRIRVEIELAVEGRTGRGSQIGVDLARCSLAAWLDAAANCLRSASPNA